MFKTKLPILLAPVLICWQITKAQILPYDTLRVMTYNVNNYGFPSTTGCPTLSAPAKAMWLRTVLDYYNPDILGLEKMDGSPTSFSTDSIVHKVLDSVCNGCYGHTPFTNVSGYQKENLLYYNKNKLGWISTITIYSADNNISDINLHRLFYKSPSLSITHDTIFVGVILVHLQSGSGSANQRASEMTGAMTWLDNHVTSPRNYIFIGDFNTQSSSESCYQQMVSSSNPNTLFFDPVNQPGNWDNNPLAFANYLTQSTRISDPGDCGATSGMDDRFDHILCTNNLMQGTDSLQYVSGSYQVIGQDGLHVNKAIIDTPQNSSVPPTVLSALYNMSEHLPVVLSLAVGGNPPFTTVAPNPQDEKLKWTYTQFVTDQLEIKFTGWSSAISFPYYASVYNIAGQKISQTEVVSANSTIHTSLLPEGIYILCISKDWLPVTTGKFIKLKSK
ncbi:MAG: Endonuclease/exonuclease/phosphatase [Bacteroidota bacterium]|nr:Endonuclease/exonuclease/phosphatase [Bacteroidota bacterium]